MNYNTNQICNFCNRFNKDCDGRMHELYKQSVNHYCPYFKDRLYGIEQQNKYWHLDDFVKNYEK